MLYVKKSSTKKIWYNLNIFSGKNLKSGTNNDAEKWFVNNVLYDNKLDIANTFNQYFIDVGDKLANALTLASVNFTDYLGPPIQWTLRIILGHPFRILSL